jgi:hypothetical protein
MVMAAVKKQNTNENNNTSNTKTNENNNTRNKQETRNKELVQHLVLTEEEQHCIMHHNLCSIWNSKVRRANQD